MATRSSSPMQTLPFQHNERATLLTAGWQIILLCEWGWWGWGWGGGWLTFFHWLFYLSLSLSLLLSPHDPILLFNHIYSLPSFRQLFSPSLFVSCSPSLKNRLDGIISGARERTLRPLLCSSNISNTRFIPTTHANAQLFHVSASREGCCVKNASHDRFPVAPSVGKQHNFHSAPPPTFGRRALEDWLLQLCSRG